MTATGSSSTRHVGGYKVLMIHQVHAATADDGTKQGGGHHRVGFRPRRMQPVRHIAFL